MSHVLGIACTTSLAAANSKILISAIRKGAEWGGGQWRDASARLIAPGEPGLGDRPAAVGGGRCQQSQLESAAAGASQQGAG
jgi:hypothetical protein